MFLVDFFVCCFYVLFVWISLCFTLLLEVECLGVFWNLIVECVFFIMFFLENVILVFVVVL